MTGCSAQILLLMDEKGKARRSQTSARLSLLMPEFGGSDLQTLRNLNIHIGNVVTHAGRDRQGESPQLPRKIQQAASGRLLPVAKGGNRPIEFGLYACSPKTIIRKFSAVNGAASRFKGASACSNRSYDLRPATLALTIVSSLPRHPSIPTPRLQNHLEFLAVRVSGHRLCHAPGVQ